MVEQVKRANDFGISIDNIQVDFGKIFAKIRAMRTHYSYRISAATLQQQGIDLYLGKAVFTAKNIVQVDNRVLSFKKAVIATGAKPYLPYIPGLDTIPYHTTDTIFNLTTQPKKLAIIGSGFAGCEFAQAFQKLGTSVVLFNRSERILSKVDADCVKILYEQFVHDGMVVHLRTVVSQVSYDVQSKQVSIQFEDKTSNSKSHVLVDEVLVCTGRVPQMEGISLEEIGVAVTADGIKTNASFQTSNSSIYAGGDVVADIPKFAHSAEVAARHIIRSALFFGAAKKSDLLVPAVLYTMPQLAYIGIQHHEAVISNVAVTVLERELKDSDKNICESNGVGYMKLIVGGNDKLVGASIVHADAALIVPAFVILIQNEASIDKLLHYVFPYPSVFEAAKQLAEEYLLQNMKAK